MHLSSFDHNKAPLQMPCTGEAGNTGPMGLILMKHKALSEGAEGICRISFQYDGDDNRSATCAGDKSSFAAFDF